MGTIISWTTTGAFLVHGQVSGFEYEDATGASVTVANARTGNNATVTVDDSGAYSVDLGNAINFPLGYQSGDEIDITAAYRGASRTWRAQLNLTAADLAQDCYFTHGTWRGAARRAKVLVTSDVYLNQAGPVITLRDASTRDIVEVRVNGARQASTAWTFQRPTTLTILNGLSLSDVVDVDRMAHRSITEVKNELVAEGEAQVRDATARYYPSPFPNRVPQLQEISEALTAARLRDMLWAGADKPDAEAQSLRKFARDRLEQLREGKLNLTDAQGAFLAPTPKTVTTPRSDTVPQRQFARFTDTNTRIDLSGTYSGGGR